VTGARVDGQACSLEDAVEAAARMLSAARLALVFGLVQSTVEAQREAVRIARLLQGCVDGASTPSHAASSSALEQIGLLTASLGELRRAELVLFWGCDPDQADPGFTERHASAPARARITVDVGDARGPAAIPDRVTLPAEREVESLLALRAFVRGRRVEGTPPGLPLHVLRTLAERLTSCRYGIVFYDADPPSSRREPERAWALSALVRDARPRAQLRLLGVRAAANAVGAESVLAWQTGFSGAVSFAAGEPRHGRGEFSGEALLRRRDVDAALLVGAAPADHLSEQARSGLDRIATVRVGALAGEAGRVFIPAAPLAASSGTVFRMDGVALRHRVREESPLPSEASVLSRIAAAIAIERRARP
jgi:formylmethanofuran dehydrogenase subunit B